MSKFAPDVPSSLIDAVSSILGEAKVEPAAPDAEAIARKKKLDALRDKREADAAEKGDDKEKPAVRKIAGKAYGGAKQKDEPEQHDEAYGCEPKKEELKGNQHKIDANKNGKIDAHDFKLLRSKKKVEEQSELDERELTPGETEKKEKYVMSMKKGLAGFKSRYGDRAKNVMYATATKLAKNEEIDYIEEAIINHEDIAKHLIKKHGKDVSMNHIEDAIDGMDDAHKVDKREVLYHVNKLTKEEVDINEGKMKDIYTDMMAHVTKKGYSSHKDFTSADYDTVGKQHGISGKELAVIAGHKTAAKVANEAVDTKKKDLPFTPDKPRAPIATAGKYGYGPSAAKHLAKLGMKNLKKEETVTEGTGGPIYPKPFVKLGDILARVKDMRNIKKATIVTPKDENEVVLKKEESEQVDESAGDRLLQAAREYKNGSAGYHKGMIKYHDHMADVHYSDKPKRKEHEENIRHHESELAALKSESYMGKAGCTSEDDKKKVEKPVDYDKPTFLRKIGDWRKSNPAHLPKPTKEEVELDERVITPGTGTSPDPLLARTGLNKVLRKPRAGQTNLKNIPAGNLPGSQYKFSDDEKIKQKTLLKTAIKSTLANKEHGKSKLPEQTEQIDELSKKTLGLYISKAADPLSKKSNVNLSSRAASKLASVSSYDSGKDDGSKDDNKAYLRSKGIQNAAKRLSKEEVELDETAVLDKYIRSMGYDPQHLDKNKKVMFAKTNAYKTFASTQKSEALYDGGQKGTQDIDTHMSPGATARGK